MTKKPAGAADAAPFTTILIPLRGPPWTTDAVPAALSIADPVATRLVLLTLLEPCASCAGDPGEQQVRTQLDRLAHQIRSQGYAHVEVHVKRGEVARQILEEADTEQADTEQADLIALVTRGAYGPKRALLGSTGERVLTASRCSVLLVGPLAVPVRGLGAILVAVDGSARQTATLQLAERVAQETRACLAVLRVLRVVPRLGQGGIVEGHVEAGVEPAAVIVRTAHSLHADLIIVATHGRRGLERAVLGSVADELVRTAEQPVLVVRGVAASASHTDPAPLTCSASPSAIIARQRVFRREPAGPLEGQDQAAPR